MSQFFSSIANFFLGNKREREEEEIIDIINTENLYFSKKNQKRKYFIDKEIKNICPHCANSHKYYYYYHTYGNSKNYLSHSNLTQLPKSLCDDDAQNLIANPNTNQNENEKKENLHIEDKKVVNANVTNEGMNERNYKNFLVNFDQHFGELYLKDRQPMTQNNDILNIHNNNNIKIPSINEESKITNKENNKGNGYLHFVETMKQNVKKDINDEIDVQIVDKIEDTSKKETNNSNNNNNFIISSALKIDSSSNEGNSINKNNEESENINNHGNNVNSKEIKEIDSNQNEKDFNDTQKKFINVTSYKKIYEDSNNKTLDMVNNDNLFKPNETKLIEQQNKDEVNESFNSLEQKQQNELRKSIIVSESQESIPMPNKDSYSFIMQKMREYYSSLPSSKSNVNEQNNSPIILNQNIIHNNSQRDNEEQNENNQNNSSINYNNYNNNNQSNSSFNLIQSKNNIQGNLNQSISLNHKNTSNNFNHNCSPTPVTNILDEQNWRNNNNSPFNISAPSNQSHLSFNFSSQINENKTQNNYNPNVSSFNLFNQSELLSSIKKEKENIENIDTPIKIVSHIFPIQNESELQTRKGCMKKQMTNDDNINQKKTVTFALDKNEENEISNHNISLSRSYTLQDDYNVIILHRYESTSKKKNPKKVIQFNHSELSNNNNTDSEENNQIEVKCISSDKNPSTYDDTDLKDEYAFIQEFVKMKNEKYYPPIAFKDFSKVYK